MKRLLGKYYRDLTALAYLFFLYPLFARVAEFDPASKEWTLVAALWLVIAVAGVIANIIILDSLGPDIEAHKLHKVVRAPVMRFLAGLVTLPLMVVLPVFIWVDGQLEQAAVPDWALGLPYIIIGGVLWLLLNPTGGAGRKRERRPHAPRAANVALVVFELFMYTVFLEGFASGDGGFHVSLGSLFILIIPTTGLFFLLFLPATFAFYIRACVRHRSWEVAAGALWLRFVITRYLPVYIMFFLESQGRRLPWYL